MLRTDNEVKSRDLYLDICLESMLIYILKNQILCGMDMIKSSDEIVQLPKMYIKRKSFYIMKVIYNSVIKPDIHKKCKKCTTIFK